jgi:hypothetical protein
MANIVANDIQYAVTLNQERTSHRPNIRLSPRMEVAHSSAKCRYNAPSGDVLIQWPNAGITSAYFNSRPMPVKLSTWRCAQLSAKRRLTCICVIERHLPNTHETMYVHVSGFVGE